MTEGLDTKAVLDFLTRLRDNNNREWFEANRASYGTARAAFLGLVGSIIDNFDSVDDLGDIGVKDCVFRINRDLRFSKDKSPYKTAMSALLGRSGRKSLARSYYIHIEPEGRSMFAGGLYDPSSAELEKLCQTLARDARPFKRLLAAPDFVSNFGSLSGDSLKTAPQGYSKGHPEIELLRMKQFIAARQLDDATVLAQDLVSLALGAFKAMKPFLVYLESSLG